MKTTIPGNRRAPRSGGGLRRASLLLSLPFLALASGTASGQARDIKYLWLDGVRVETRSFSAKDTALDDLEGTQGQVAFTNACRERLGRVNLTYIVEIADLHVRTLQTYRQEFKASGTISGYCSVLGLFDNYEALDWCKDMKRGQSQCAVDFPY
jgi:hypothetical protein